MPGIDYIIIGAHKAGTSWIYKMFQELSDFSNIPIKEFHYFDFDKEIYDDISPLGHKFFFKRVFKITWIKIVIKIIWLFLFTNKIKFSFIYFFIFSNYDDKFYINFFKYFDKINGDITPSYTCLKFEDVLRMKNIVNNYTKIILVLRDPIERSWSNFKHARRLGMYRNLNKNEINEILSSNFVTCRSDYLNTISLYSKIFGSRFRFFFYDDLKKNPKMFLESLVKFIGGNPDNVKKLDKIGIRVNATKEIKINEVHLNQLKSINYQNMLILSKKYGGHFTKWFNKYYK